MAACSDLAGPGTAAPSLQLQFEDARSDTTNQLAVAVTAARSDSAHLKGLRLYLDSANAPTPAAQNYDLYGTGGTALKAVVFLPGPGRYTITAAVTDSAGRVTSASFTRTVAPPDSVAYAAAALPDLGGAASAEWVHANGTVVGSVTTPQGRVRPAVWRGGQLAVPAVTDSSDASAVRVNSAGDVLLQYRTRLFPSSGMADTTFVYARVLRADGVLLAFGPWLPPYAGADDLTDNRRALAHVGDSFSRGRSATLDVAAGRVVDTASGAFVALNAAGQSVGTQPYLPPDISRLLTRGFTAPALPTQIQASGCGNHVSHIIPTGFDDDANFIADHCRNVAFMSARGSVWLDRYVGRAAAARAQLSQQGGLVAALDSARGALYLWRADTRRAAELRVAGGWRVDRIGGVNATGQIAAHGVNTTTGRAAALLLTPAR